MGALLTCLLLVAAPTDPALDVLRARLPAGWTLQRTSTELVLARSAKVHALFQNQINAPVSRENQAAREARIVAAGREVACRLVYRVEPRWDSARLAQVRREAQQLQARRADLRAQAVAAGAKVDRKTGELWAPEGPGQDRVAALQRELATLDAAERTALPDCQTRTLALFGPTRAGVSDALTLVVPEEASQEAAAVESLVRTLCVP